MNADLEIALKLADGADSITMSRFHALDLQVETKPDNTPVTEADKAVEQFIRDELAALLPEDGVVGEEHEDTKTDAARQWIVDPIDGTKNYLRGVPVWATLIALVENGVPIVGVVSAPALGRRWWSSVGEGAYTRDVDGDVRGISVSNVKSLADASFSYSDEIGWEKHGSGNGLASLQQATWRSRAYGDFWSHVMVAEGVVDVAAEPDLSVWDMAAFIAIVTEAGGVVTALDGGDAMTNKSALTSNGQLHTAALAVITTH